MQLTVLGCGDAFGSGGRLQTCFHVAAGSERFLIDCGATVMIAMHRQQFDPNSISTIFISHLHGDHFSGLVWWLIHAQHVARRSVPLTIVGPPGIARRVVEASEVLFPGSSMAPLRFDVKFIEFAKEVPQTVGGVTVVPYEVSHPSGAMSCALRLTVGGKTVSFSGDSEWTDTLLPCAKGSDLFIAECFGYDMTVPYHMSWQIIRENMERLGARRVLLSHMAGEMLAKQGLIKDPRVLLAADGQVIDI